MKILIIPVKQGENTNKMSANAKVMFVVLMDMLKF